MNEKDFFEGDGYPSVDIYSNVVGVSVGDQDAILAFKLYTPDKVISEEAIVKNLALVRMPYKSLVDLKNILENVINQKENGEI